MFLVLVLHQPKIVKVRYPSSIFVPIGFAIGSPNVNRPMNPDGFAFPPADPINIPFIVTTTGRYVNGVYSPRVRT